MSHSPSYSGSDLCRLQAFEVVELLKRRKVSPAELLAASFDRIKAVEPAINAMPTTCRDRAEAALANLDSADKNHPGYLGGLPIGIKDLTPVAGVRTTLGTVGKANWVPEVSDPLVERLESRGGVVVGKTNTPEMGAGGNTFNAVFGNTRNPWDTRMNPAGSSGGAAASLATGETWLSHGSDHGGSLRTPAAYCGVVGLRPSPGRVASGSDAGFIIEGAQGPMARSVRDCALFLDAMSGFDPRCPISYPAPDQSFQDAVLQADGKVRIAFSPDLNGFSPVEKDMRDHLAQAMARIESNGAVVEEACPDLTSLEATYHTLRGMMWAASVRRAPESQTKHYKKTLAENTAFGQSLTMDDVSDANLNRTTLYHNTRKLLENFDVLACPTVGNMPRPIEVEWVDTIDGQKLSGYMDWLRFAFLSTTTGLPSISVPVGLGVGGMPVGLQLIGPPRGEAKLLAVARAVEAACGGPLGPIDPNVRH